VGDCRGVLRILEEGIRYDPEPEIRVYVDGEPLDVICFEPGRVVIRIRGRYVLIEEGVVTVYPKRR